MAPFGQWNKTSAWIKRIEIVLLLMVMANIKTKYLTNSHLNISGIYRQIDIPILKHEITFCFYNGSRSIAQWVTDHNRARCIFPNARKDPLCSTRVPVDRWRRVGDSSWQRQLYCRQHTYCLRYRHVSAETATSRPGSFCHSPLQTCGQRTDVPTVSDCRLLL